jgi:hydrogenase maturation protease
VTIVGMGNQEMGDDGIGVALARMMSEQAEAQELPEGTEIVCAERDPAMAAALLAEGRNLLVIDAVEMKCPPGSWRVFSAHEAQSCREPGARGSTHGFTLEGVLELARGMGWADRLHILGIQVGEVRPGRFLSPGVQRCVPEVLSRIRQEAEAQS